MEIQVIHGRKYFIFSDNEQRYIIEQYMSGRSMCSLCREFNVSMKPIKRVLDNHNIDHSRGNLRAYKKFFPNGIYDSDIEKEIYAKIQNESKYGTYIKYNVNQEYFDVVDTEYKAYIIGLLYADGYNSCTYGKRYIRIGLEESDENLLLQINSLLCNEKPLRYIDNSYKDTETMHFENMYDLTINSTHMSDSLAILGVTQNKSLTITFPKWLKSSLYSHFIRGVFDGDGSLYKYTGNKSQVTATITATEEFCKALCDIVVDNIGINPHYYDASCHNGITKVFTISGVDVVRKFLFWMYRDAHIYLNRKYQRYCDYYNINNSLVA